MLFQGAPKAIGGLALTGLAAQPVIAAAISPQVFNFGLQANMYFDRLANLSAPDAPFIQPYHGDPKNSSDIAGDKLNLTDPYLAWDQHRKTEPGRGFWEKNMNTTVAS